MRCCMTDMGLWNGGLSHTVRALVLFYRRHSGLRTMRGGICWGRRLRSPIRWQLRLLGYQRIVKSFALRRNLSLVSQSNIRLYTHRHGIVMDGHPPPYRPIQGRTFARSGQSVALDGCLTWRHSQGAIKPSRCQSLTGISLSARYCFISLMLYLPKWAMEATRTASACPSMIAS